MAKPLKKLLLIWKLDRQNKKRHVHENTEFREGNQEVLILLEGEDVVNKILVNKVLQVLVCEE